MIIPNFNLRPHCHEILRDRLEWAISIDNRGSEKICIDNSFLSLFAKEKMEYEIPNRKEALFDSILCVLIFCEYQNFFNFYIIRNIVIHYVYV
jgi:hypothetical protein